MKRSRFVEHLRNSKGTLTIHCLGPVAKETKSPPVIKGTPSIQQETLGIGGLGCLSLRRIASLDSRLELGIAEEEDPGVAKLRGLHVPAVAPQPGYAPRST